MTTQPTQDPDTATLAAIGRMTDDERKVLQVVHRMLDAIHSGDADAYAAMCTDDVSCYETDVAPFRIDTLGFHLDLIREMSRLGTYSGLVRADVLTPRVQIVGDAAIATFTRLMSYGGETAPRWSAFNETRVFARTDGAWKMVHFHRSAAG